ncbi:unnamed protein product, partial [Didymodactylos carnosus]
RTQSPPYDYRNKRRRPSSVRHYPNRHMSPISDDDEKPDGWCDRPGCLGLTRLCSILFFSTLGIICLIAIGGIFTCTLLYIEDSSTDTVWKIFGIVLCGTVVVTVFIITMCMIIFYNKNNAINDDGIDSVQYYDGYTSESDIDQNNPRYGPIHNHKNAYPQNNGHNSHRSHRRRRHSSDEYSSSSPSLNENQPGSPIKLLIEVNNKPGSNDPVVTVSNPNQTWQTQSQQHIQPRHVYSNPAQSQGPRPMIVEVLDNPIQSQNLRSNSVVKTKISTIQLPQQQQQPSWYRSAGGQPRKKHLLPSIDYIEQQDQIKRQSLSPEQKIIPPHEFYELDKYY